MCDSYTTCGRVGWETPKHTGKHQRTQKGCKTPDTLLTHATHKDTPLFEDVVDDNVAAAVAEVHGMSVGGTTSLVAHTSTVYSTVENTYTEKSLTL